MDCIFFWFSFCSRSLSEFNVVLPHADSSNARSPLSLSSRWQRKNSNRDSRSTTAAARCRCRNQIEQTWHLVKATPPSKRFTCLGGD
ncbi:hypothetical protein DFH27DRAFT_583295 [Peziza echinospora]|nr:hypothetical protein DFH27DRAFT_583295 [Peziza echinospora]